MGLTTLAAGTLALNPLTGAAETAPSLEPVEPVWVPLTKDIKVTRVGFGTGMRGRERRSDLTRLGDAKAIEMLRSAYDQGVRLFDLADLYGTHDVIHQAFRDKPRDSYVLITKVWLHPGNILPEMERPDPGISVRRFLRELRTDYIDIVMLHCMMNDRWSDDFSSQMESLETLKQEGLIRAHGMSSHSTAATERAAQIEWGDVILVRLNSEGFNMDGFPDDPVRRVAESVRVAKLAHDAGKGIIAMKVLGEGRMTENPEMRKKSTAFVSQLDCVDSMIAGFTAMEHIPEFIANVKAAERLAG